MGPALPQAAARQPPRTPDMKTFRDVISAVYEAAAEPARWPLALQHIADHFGDFGAVMVFAKDNKAFGAMTSPSIVTGEDWHDRAYADLRIRHRRDRDYLLEEDVLTEAKADQDPPYRDFLAQYGLNHFAAVSVSPLPNIEAALSIQRHNDRGPFSAAEMQELSHISTHVERALGLGIHLLEARLFREGLLAAFDRVGHGIIALGEDGRIHHMNAGARALVGQGLADRNGLLWLDDPAAQARLQAHLAGAQAQPEDKALPTIVAKRQQDHELVIRLVPVARKDHHILVNARFIALISTTMQTGVIQPDILQDIYALTRAEARLAAIVGAGRSPGEAASVLGITEQTARSVLKRIFQKTGVSRQGELVHLFSRLLEQL